MANHTPAPVDQAQKERAENTWHSFIHYSKIAIMLTIGLLCALAAFLL